MKAYKPHYACFKCRKTFKRRLMGDMRRGSQDEFTEAKCPQCGELMANMGLDFASPKKDSIKEWNHIKNLYSVGLTFHSCGCTGPGYIPKDKNALIAYFEDMIVEYQKQLIFWRNRAEPSNEKEIQREESKNWDYISSVPHELRPKKGAITSEDAKKYWLGRIKDVEERLNKIKSVVADL